MRFSMCVVIVVPRWRRSTVERRVRFCLARITVGATDSMGRFNTCRTSLRLTAWTRVVMASQNFLLSSAAGSFGSNSTRPCRLIQRGRSWTWMKNSIHLISRTITSMSSVSSSNLSTGK